MPVWGQRPSSRVVHENVSVVEWTVRGAEQITYIQSFDDTTGTFEFTILAVAEENDGAEVVCIPITIYGAIEESEPAILRVQGMCSLVASTWL